MEGERNPSQIFLLTLTIVNVYDKQPNILRIFIIERFDVWQKINQRSQPQQTFIVFYQISRKT